MRRKPNRLELHHILAKNGQRDEKKDSSMTPMMRTITAIQNPPPRACLVSEALPEATLLTGDPRDLPGLTRSSRPRRESELAASIDEVKQIRDRDDLMGSYTDQFNHSQVRMRKRIRT